MTHTADEALTALLADILTHPDDDTPRLAYADRLDELGEPEPCAECMGGRWQHYRCCRCGVVFRAVHKYSDCGSVGCEGERVEPAPCHACRDAGSVNGKAERAEFVRVQVARAAWRFERPHTVCHHEPECDNCCRCGWCLLRRREAELLKAHRKKWLMEGVPSDWSYWQSNPNQGWCVPTTPGPGEGLRAIAGIDCEFRRGFVESVTCTLADWLAHGSAVVLAQPVTRVEVSDREPGRAGDGTFSWYFADNPPGHARHYLPWKLRPYFPVNDDDLYSRTPEAARAALSTALVNGVRAAAGLPPLA